MVRVAALRKTKQNYRHLLITKTTVDEASTQIPTRMTMMIAQISSLHRGHVKLAQNLSQVLILSTREVHL